jgi:peptide deformylase
MHKKLYLSGNTMPTKNTSYRAKYYPLQFGANNPILRTIASPIEEINDEIVELMEALEEGVIRHEWVWIAAPQLGHSKRVMLVTERKGRGHRDKLKYKRDHIMINPEIIETSAEMIESDEGCLSLPGMAGYVSRHEKITVTYTDPQGRSHTKQFSWFNATIVQHELDHLNGVLFIDKLIK